MLKENNNYKIDNTKKKKKKKEKDKPKGELPRSK